MAHACIAKDRYRRCRRTCGELSDHLKKYPRLPEEALKLYSVLVQSSIFESMKFAGKGLVNPLLKCPECRFVAKSKLGLKQHRTRQHNKSGG